MRASVVITTKNRRDELRAAVYSAVRQSVQPEVLVIDDGSTDGTADMVREEFPAVRLDRSAESLGYIVQRNRAARMAKGEIIFSIDDDAEFSTPHVVEQTLMDFGHPRIGAVAIPYIEPRKQSHLQQAASDASGTWITETFIGTAHALRRDVFLKLGGYRDHLIHQGEESDFCIRLLEAGYLVRLGRSEPVKHWASPKRDLRRMDFYGPRNAILFAWQNVPALALPERLAAAAAATLIMAFRIRRPWCLLLGLLNGCALYSKEWPRRQPVKWATYRQFRRLRKRGPLALTECG